MNNLKILLFIMFFIAGCGPGASDFSEKIEDTGLTFVDTNTLSMTIEDIGSVDISESLIGPSVLSYFVEGGYVIGVRQIINHYRCGDVSKVEVTDNIEFFAIDYSKKNEGYVTKKFDLFFDFNNYLKLKDVNIKKVEKLKLKASKYRITPITPMIQCT